MNTEPRHRTAKSSAIWAILASALTMGAPSALGLVSTRGVDTSPVPSPSPISRPEDPNIIDWDEELLIILELLCIIVRCEQPGFSVQLSPAAERAEYVISTYSTEGLLPNLTPAEIDQGLEAAQQVRHHVTMVRGTPGTLGATLAAELDLTMADMIAELSSLRAAHDAGGR